MTSLEMENVYADTVFLQIKDTYEKLLESGKITIDEMPDFNYYENSKGKYAKIDLYNNAENDFLDLQLCGKLKYSEIPFPLRFSRTIYTGAVRVSRGNSRFSEYSKVIMEDILNVAPFRNSYLYDNELHDILECLYIELADHDFGGERSEKKFYETTYEPFVKRLRQLLPKEKR